MNWFHDNDRVTVKQKLQELSIIIINDLKITTNRATVIIQNQTFDGPAEVVRNFLQSILTWISSWRGVCPKIRTLSLQTLCSESPY
jgi:hypothetical protein